MVRKMGKGKDKGHTAYLNEVLEGPFTIVHRQRTTAARKKEVYILAKWKWVAGINVDQSPKYLELTFALLTCFQEGKITTRLQARKEIASMLTPSTMD